MYVQEDVTDEESQIGLKKEGDRIGHDKWENGIEGKNKYEKIKKVSRWNRRGA